MKKCKYLLMIILLILVVVLYGSGESKKSEYRIKMEEGDFISVDEYIAGAMMAFVPAEYGDESMKAVAVMLRTFIINEFETKQVMEIDIGELDVPYVFLDSIKNVLGDEVFYKTMEKYRGAVEETKGQVITYEGSLIVPLYHMVSAGSTRSGKDVLEEEIPYLREKESKRDLESPDFLKIVEMEREEYEDILKEVFQNDIAKVEVGQRDAAGYVMFMRNGEIQVPGEEFANALDLNSSCFFIDISEKKVKIVTKGQGHGLGLSVYGAWNMAKDGKDYIEILKYYYDGVEVE